MRFLFFLIIVFAPYASGAGEYLGVYDEEPVFEVKTDIDSQPTLILKKAFKFRDPNGIDWIAPPNTEVDGASIPSFAWTFVGAPMTGNYIHASIIHDYYCRTKTRTAHDTHRSFLYGLRAKGVSKWKAHFMYWAVRTFGPDWKIAKRLKCRDTSTDVECTFVDAVTDERAPIDETNPEKMSIAMAIASDVASGIYMCTDCFASGAGGAAGHPDADAIGRMTPDDIDRIAAQARRDFDLFSGGR